MLNMCMFSPGYDFCWYLFARHLGLIQCMNVGFNCIVIVCFASMSFDFAKETVDIAKEAVDFVLSWTGVFRI